MYIIYSGSAKQYASAARTVREGKRTRTVTTYLGRVVDREEGVYSNRERGYFTFDTKTGEYGPVPEGWDVPATEEADGRSRELSHMLDFGDAFALDSFLWATGMMEVVDSVGVANKDTLHAMLLFYMLSTMANCDARTWFEGSVAGLMYPDASMSSQRVSDFLAALGDPDRQLAFQTRWIEFVNKKFKRDGGILIDSTGLPNSVHFPLTCVSKHNGKVSTEVRLIIVVQRTTGLPIFYQAIPGNVVDVSTLERVLLHLEALGVDVDLCIIDAGYESGPNLDLFYGDDKTCKTGYITRLSSDDSNLLEVASRRLADIRKEENLVRYQDRCLFMVREEVKVGKNKDKPAWLYLGVDVNRAADEQRKLMRRAKTDGLSDAEIVLRLEREGVFAVVSGRKLTCGEVLPAYYQRQAAEQVFDYAKNYTKMLPLRTHTVETFQGHLLLSYMATCAIKLVQMRMREASLTLGSRFQGLRNQKCRVYKGRIVTDVPQRFARESYAALGVECPAAITISGGRLALERPKAGSVNPRPRKARTRTGGKGKAAEPAKGAAAEEGA